jgi:hypothetical protein
LEGYFLDGRSGICYMEECGLTPAVFVSEARS